MEYQVTYDGVAFYENPDEDEGRKRGYSIAAKGDILSTTKGGKHQYIPESEASRLMERSPGSLVKKGDSPITAQATPGAQPVTPTSPESADPEAKAGVSEVDEALAEANASTDEAVEEFTAMQAPELRAIAEQHGVPADGSKRAVAERLVAMGVLPLPEGAGPPEPEPEPEE